MNDSQPVKVIEETYQRPQSITQSTAIVDNGDYEWASRHSWRLHTDEHVVRDGTTDEPELVYLCNEVMSRATATPLEAFNPPFSAVRH